MSERTGPYCIPDAWRITHSLHKKTSVHFHLHHRRISLYHHLREKRETRYCSSKLPPTQTCLYKVCNSIILSTSDKLDILLSFFFFTLSPHEQHSHPSPCSALALAAALSAHGYATLPDDFLPHLWFCHRLLCRIIRPYSRVIGLWFRVRR